MHAWTEHPIDLEHCPTCGMAYVECGAIWPTSAHDVEHVRCKLPRGHRSAEHWHPPIWPRQPDLIWRDDEQEA